MTVTVFMVIRYLEYASRRLRLVANLWVSLSSSVGVRDSTPYSSLKEYSLNQAGLLLLFLFASCKSYIQVSASKTF
jgi:hypothetical protein